MSHERLRHPLALLLPFSPSLRKLDLLTPMFWQAVLKINSKAQVHPVIATRWVRPSGFTPNI